MNAQTGRRAHKRTYATKPKIRAAVEIARELGLDVAGFEISPEGAIRVFEARAETSTPQNEFDRYEHEL